MSVNRKVTVPVGGLLTLSSLSLLPRGHYSSARYYRPFFLPLFTEVPRRGVLGNPSVGELLKYAGVGYMEDRSLAGYPEGNGRPSSQAQGATFCREITEYLGRARQDSNLRPSDS